jgi:hypothetical protein
MYSSEGGGLFNISHNIEGADNLLSGQVHKSCLRTTKVVYFLILRIVERLSIDWKDVFFSLRFEPLYEFSEGEQFLVDKKSEELDKTSLAPGAILVPKNNDRLGSIGDVDLHSSSSPSSAADQPSSATEGSGAGPRCVVVDSSSSSSAANKKWMNGLLYLNFSATLPRLERLSKAFAAEEHLEFYSLDQLLRDICGESSVSGDGHGEMYLVTLPFKIASVGRTTTAMTAAMIPGFRQPLLQGMAVAGVAPGVAATTTTAANNYRPGAGTVPGGEECHEDMAMVNDPNESSNNRYNSNYPTIGSSPRRPSSPKPSLPTPRTSRGQGPQ